MKASDNDFPSFLVTEQGSTPSTPAASHQRLFVRTSDHLLCYVNSSGTVSAVGTGLTDPMTTRGDVIIRNASNVTARLGIGSAGKVLSSDGTDISWQTPSAGSITNSTADQSADVTLSGDTIADATGATLSLAAGTWVVFGMMCISTTDATAHYCLMAITDGSNTKVAEARNAVSSASPTSMYGHAVVTPGSTTTYKLRGQAGTGGGTIKIIKNPEGGSEIGTRITAIRLA